MGVARSAFEWWACGRHARGGSARRGKRSDHKGPPTVKFCSVARSGADLAGASDVEGFVAEMTIEEGNCSGIGFDFVDGSFMRINYIDKDSPAAKYNARTHADKRIRTGDFVVAVNSVMGKARAMKHALMTIGVVQVACACGSDSGKRAARASKIPVTTELNKRRNFLAALPVCAFPLDSFVLSPVCRPRCALLASASIGLLARTQAGWRNMRMSTLGLAPPPCP